MKKLKKRALSMIVLAIFLITFFSLTVHNIYSSNSYLKKIFYVEGEGDPNDPPPGNIPIYLG